MAIVNTAADGGRTVDVQQVIDGQRVRGPHLVLLALCTLIMFLDGFDIFMVGKLAPAIAEDFGEPAKALTLVFLLQQIGLTAGAFVISPLSDRFGRKASLIGCALAFGILTLATVWAQSLLQVGVLRLLQGIFLAGVIPNAAALLTEFAPPKRRAFFVSIAFTGYTAGGAAGAFVAIYLLKDYGWQSGFWIGGIVPLLFVPLFMLFGHESVQFRARRNPADPAIGRTLKVFDPSLDLAGVTTYSVGPARAPKATGGVAAVFTQGRAPVTLLFWGTYFMALGLITLFGAWMATFFHELGGISLQEYAAVSLISFAGGMAGTTTIGWIMDRFKATRVLMILFLIDAVAIAALGMLPFGSPASLVAFTVWGYAQAGGQAGINALCAQAYPSEIRSTGVGWAFGMGRFGGIFLPMLGGLALATSITLQQAFLFAAVIPLFVVLLIFGFDRLAARGKFGA